MNPTVPTIFVLADASSYKIVLLFQTKICFLSLFIFVTEAYRYTNDMKYTLQ